MTALSPLQRRTFIRFGAVMAVGSLVWEMAHVSLYSLWQTGSWGAIAYAVLHCTLGDMIIATACLGGAIIVFGQHGWPERHYAKVAVAAVAAALCYTVFSEWLNVEIRQSWAYRDMMPTLPILGTGVTPLMQWLVVPSVAFWWARRDSLGVR